MKDPIHIRWIALLVTIVMLQSIVNAQHLKVAGTGSFGNTENFDTTYALNVAGDIFFRSGALIANRSNRQNIDYIWYNDLPEIPGLSGTWHFVGDSPIGSNGNTRLRAGHVYMGSTNHPNVFAGKVGIGTSVPETKLDLRGDFYFLNSRASWFRSDRTDSDFDITQSESSTDRALSIHAGENGGTVLSVYHRNNSQYLPGLFVKNGTGRVGIGTSSPVAKLDVQGGFFFTNENGSNFYTSRPDSDFDVVQSNSSTKRAFTVHGGDNGDDVMEVFYRMNGEYFPALTVLNGPPQVGIDLGPPRVGINNGNPLATLDVGGLLAVRYMPLFDGRNVQWDNSLGWVGYDNSSRRDKRNIRDLKEDFDLLLDAKPKTYTRPLRPERWEIGFIAEDFHDLGLTPLIEYDTLGRPDGLRYDKMVTYIVPILRKQRDENRQLERDNRQLKSEIDNLKDRLAKIEALLAKESSPTSTTISSAILEQNHPNPFYQTTSIRYVIPEGIRKAELQISNSAGKQLRIIQIDQRGAGQTDLQAHSLSAGSYFYTLVVDGRIIDTKKMVLTGKNK